MSIVIPERNSNGDIIWPANRKNTPGWKFHKAGITFTTSTLNGYINSDATGADLGFTTMKFYDNTETELVAGTQAELDANCTKTVIDWMPTFDYEVVAGYFDQIAAPTGDTLLYVIGAPDYTPAQGGSVPFICCVNLSLIPPGSELGADGRAVNRMNYNGGVGTNKLRLIIRHSLALKHKAMISYEMYKA